LLWRRRVSTQNFYSSKYLLTENYSSYSGYSRIGFDRRFRIYDISDFGETIRTYKRTEKDDILDEMILTGTGSPHL
jgi:hypothetical protein